MNIIPTQYSKEFPRTLPKVEGVSLSIDTRRLLEFCLKYPQQWHTFKQDAPTVKAVTKLRELGLLDTAEDQFYYHGGK